MIRFFFLGIIEGLLALFANKFRSSLTMLGVVIGVMSIVSVVSIGDSGKQRILDEISKTAQPNMMWVFPNWVHVQKMQKQNREVKFLTFDDFVELGHRCINYGFVSTRNTDRQMVRYGNVQDSVRMAGVTSQYFKASQMELAEGRWFNKQDEDEHRRVCLLGADIRRQFFRNEPILGKVIRAGNLRYTVIGALAQKGTSAFEFRSYDNYIYVPLATMQHFDRSERNVHWFIGMAHSVDLVPVFRAKIHQTIRELGFPEDLMDSRTLLEETATFEKISLILKLLIAGIAGISLFVGGLGIMNIMLVTVKERTREIGLRKALGASSLGIRYQFFVESTIMSLTGGLIGAGLGIGLTYAINMVTQFPTVISQEAIFWGIFISFLVGLLFGIYPAHRAASLDPAEALRYE